MRVFSTCERTSENKEETGNQKEVIQMRVAKLVDFDVRGKEVVFVFDEEIKPNDGVTNTDLKKQAMEDIAEFCKGYLDGHPHLERFDKIVSRLVD